MRECSPGRQGHRLEHMCLRARAHTHACIGHTSTHVHTQAGTQTRMHEYTCTQTHVRAPTSSKHTNSPTRGCASPSTRAGTCAVCPLGPVSTKDAVFLSSPRLSPCPPCPAPEGANLRFLPLRLGVEITSRSHRVRGGARRRGPGALGRRPVDVCTGTLGWARPGWAPCRAGDGSAGLRPSRPPGESSGAPRACSSAHGGLLPRLQGHGAPKASNIHYSSLRNSFETPVLGIDSRNVVRFVGFFVPVRLGHLFDRCLANTLWGDPVRDLCGASAGCCEQASLGCGWKGHAVPCSRDSRDPTDAPTDAGTGWARERGWGGQGRPGVEVGEAGRRWENLSDGSDKESNLEGPLAGGGGRGSKDAELGKTHGRLQTRSLRGWGHVQAEMNPTGLCGRGSAFRRASGLEMEIGGRDWAVAVVEKDASSSVKTFREQVEVTFSGYRQFQHLPLLVCRRWDMLQFTVCLLPLSTTL